VSKQMQAERSSYM